MENDIRIDLNKLHPFLKHKLLIFLKKCNKQGIFLIVTEGFRTVSRQNELYSLGRTKKGNIVTNAKGNEYKSQHQWGIAFDIAINDPANLYNADLIKKAGNIGKTIGLAWGGDWISFKDFPHFYLKSWGTTTDLLRKIYKNPSNFKKTWKAIVNKKNGLALWNKSRLKKLTTIEDKSTVKVLQKGKAWTMIEFNEIVGYARSKYLGG